MLESTEAFAKFANGKSWRQLDFQTQQQIRLAAILEQAYARYGDTLADTTQSRHNQFIASLKNVQLALGQAFLPIYNAVLPPLTAFMNKLSQAISVIKIFTEAIFGKPAQAKQQSDAIKEQSGAVQSLSNSLNNASKNLNKTATSAKKAKKEIGGLIGGLDEINNLSVTTTAGSSGTSSDSTTPSTSTTTGGLGNLDTIDMGETIDTSGLEKKAEKIKEIFDRIKKNISDNKEIIIAIMAGLMAGLVVVIAANWGKIGGIFTRNFPLLTKIFTTLGKVIFKPFTLLKKGIGFLLGLNPVVAAAAVVIGVFVASLVYLWRNNKDFKDKVINTWNTLKNALEPWLEAFKIHFATLADILKTVLIPAFKIASKIVVKFVELWANSYLNLFQILSPIIKKLGELVLKFANSFSKGWKNVKKYFTELNKIFEEKGLAGLAEKLFIDIGKFIIEGLKNGMFGGLIGIFVFLKKYIFEPIVNGVKKLFDIHSPSRVMKEIGGFIIEGLKVGMLALLDLLPDNVKKPLKKIISTCIKFANEISKRWKKFKYFFSQVKRSIEKYGLKKTIEILLNKLKNKIKDKLKEMKDEFIKKIKDHFKEMGENIQKKWEELTKPVEDFVIDIKANVEDFKDKASDKWDGVKDWFKDKVLNVNTDVEGFEGKVSNEIDKTNETTSKKKISIKNIVEDIQGKVSNAWEIANEWVGKQKINIGNKVEDIKGKVSVAWETAQQWVNKQKLNISTKVESFYSKVKDAKDYAAGKIKSWSFTIGTKVGSFYSKVKDAFDSAKKKIKSWAFTVSLKVNTSANNVKSTINGIIKQINSAVISKIKITVPDWFPGIGGKTWGPPKNIPYLAKGGIVDSATLAVVGEQGREAVMPLENNTGWITDLAGKITSRMGDTGYSNPVNTQPREVYNGDVVIKLDGNTVLRQPIVSILRQMKRQGITI